jgi:hypothetical protein
MARYDGRTGLFDSKEFKGRGVIKIAPDAIVYINQSLQGAYLDPTTGKTKTVDFQSAISSINVQNNVDPPGSSTATIEVVTPIYDERSSFWIPFKDEIGQTYLSPWFSTMMEIQVFFKGRFLVGESPKYYSAFWGFITNVEESFSGGMYKIQLQCADMLHWWQYIQVAFRPSVEQDVYVRGNAGLTVYGSRYQTANPFEIIYSLTQAMGFENFITPAWVGKLPPDSQTQSKDPRWLSVYYQAFTYWNSRFAGDFGSKNLKMYGASGNLIDPTDPRKALRKVIADRPPNTKKANSKGQQATADDVEVVFNLDATLENLQVFHQFDGMQKDLSEAEYKNKLEIATELKTRIEYEFFQDVNGTFVFKPPFYNLNTKPLMAYNIYPQDIINFSATENSEEIITALEVAVSPQQNVHDVKWINRIGYHVDLDLVKKYGFRYKKIDSWWLSETEIARSYAVGEMGLLNAKTHTAAITIPGRPELRLGYPIYITHRDKFYYVKSINHAFDYGGSFSTTLSLEAERFRVYSAKDFTIQKSMVYKFNKQVAVDEIQAEIDIATVHKNQVALLKANTAKAVQAEKDNANGISKIVFPQEQPTTEGRTISGDPEKAMQQLLTENGLSSSMEAGMYTLVKDIAADSITKTIIPFTDEQGYRVVGAFKYGRGLEITPGTVIDVNESFKSAGSLNPVPAIIADMVPADQEGSNMATYFKGSNQAGVEGLVAPYAKLPDDASLLKPAVNQIALNIVNMSPAGGLQSTDQEDLIKEEMDKLFNHVDPVADMVIAKDKTVPKNILLQMAKNR